MAKLPLVHMSTNFNVHITGHFIFRKINHRKRNVALIALQFVKDDGACVHNAKVVRRWHTLKK